MSGKVKFKWFLCVPIFTSLFVIIILSISWADKINEKINSPINEVGIEVELKGFLKHLKKKLPKKIDDLTIFIDAGSPFRRGCVCVCATRSDAACVDIVRGSPLLLPIGC